jgi:hypothetical protein
MLLPVLRLSLRVFVLCKVVCESRHVRFRKGPRFERIGTRFMRVLKHSVGVVIFAKWVRSLDDCVALEVFTLREQLECFVTWFMRLFAFGRKISLR